MVALAATLSHLRPTTVLLVGDLILDSYTLGKAQRISPESPVLVIQVEKEECRAGGMGNAALNLHSLGATLRLLGRVGDDAEGKCLQEELLAVGISTDHLLVQPHYQTPNKNRVIASNQQIVRIDHETVEWMPEHLEQKIIEHLPSLLDGVSCIAISDYGKGFLTDTLLKELIELALLREIPVVVDPKGVDFKKYQGATLIKPNEKEAYEAAQIPFNKPIEAVAEKLLATTQAETLMITRSEKGISLFHRNQTREDFPVKPRQVKDVTGAGDTVLAAVTLALASGLSAAQATQLANIAASIVIGHLGCATVTLEEIAHALLKENTHEKLYDEEHLFAIQQVLQGKPFALLGMYQEQGITPLIYRGIKEVAALYQNRFLVYIRDPDPDLLFIEILTSLPEIEFVILKKDSLENLCRKISPEQVYVVENGEVVESIDYFALVKAP